MKGRECPDYAIRRYNLPTMAEPAQKPQVTQDESLKETLESVVMAFILAFVFRAYVVEAFVIPTGSMAPTLMGRHLEVTCEQCGFYYRVDAAGPAGETAEAVNTGSRERGRRFYDSVCPMCHFPQAIINGTRISAGDRILVHKYIYSVTDPRRWDVVVFKNPADPQTNFIKRLVGLPEESLWIIDGNVYVRPDSDPAGHWRIARKSDRENVQRAVWQPVYDSAYVPLDSGKGSSERGTAATWEMPWRPEGDWKSPLPGRFRHEGPKRATIHFDFETAMKGGSGLYAYNQFSMQNDEVVEDVRVSCTITPDSPGLVLEMGTTIRSTSLRPDAMPARVVARLDEQGAASIELFDPNTGQRETRHASSDMVTSMKPGKASEVEFWCVDQDLSLWIEGQRIIRWPYELDKETLVKRPKPSVWPQIHMSIQGGSATIHRAAVDRDIYYFSQGSEGAAPARGALVKHSASNGNDDEEESFIHIEGDEYFCLGDNSPRSSDGRYWDSVNPWILNRMLANNRQQLGVVPHKLMMGRAFFVYFPAMHAWNPTSAGLIPNFGKMRFIH